MSHPNVTVPFGNVQRKEGQSGLGDRFPLPPNHTWPVVCSVLSNEIPFKNMVNQLAT